MEGDVMVSGAVLCQRAGCANPARVLCNYVDRRQRPCPTHWCEVHSVEVESRPYCARHASTLVAVGPDVLMRGQLPELENRVPSLVYWVGSDLDDDVPTILEGHINRAAGERMVSDPVTLVTGGGRSQERRWERNWKVVSHTGIAERVTLQVVESRPTEVVVRIGQRVVATEQPPWIAARSHASAWWSQEEDIAARRAFYRTLHNAITGGLGQASIWR